MTFFSLGKIPVPTPGTRVRVTSDESIAAARIQIAVDPANTGKCYVGSSTLNKTTLAGCVRVFTAPGDGPQDGLLVPPMPGGGNVHRLADYYVDADVAAEGLLVAYWVA